MLACQLLASNKLEEEEVEQMEQEQEKKGKGEEDGMVTMVVTIEKELLKKFDASLHPEMSTEDVTKTQQMAQKVPM